MAYNGFPNDSERVLQFTEGSQGSRCPNVPRIMTEAEVRFLTRMLLSEIREFVQVTASDPDAFIMDCYKAIDKPKEYAMPTDEIDIIAQQADALVDMYYYAQNAANKAGVNLSSIFNVVHQANMDKRYDDGAFHRRPDGKIMKPPGWVEPDIYGEIVCQLAFGAWERGKK